MLGGRVAFVHQDNTFDASKTSVHVYNGGESAVSVRSLSVFGMGCGWRDDLPQPRGPRGQLERDVELLGRSDLDGFLHTREGVFVRARARAPCEVVLLVRRRKVQCCRSGAGGRTNAARHVVCQTQA